MIGLYIGRFQPFHLGHLHVVKEALEDCDTLKIVIGSAGEERTENNPWTADEREEMIRKVLEEERLLDRVDVLQVPDIPDDKEYAQHVQRITGPFDRVYVIENELNKRLFSEAGHEVVTDEKHKSIDATEVRRRMREDEDWRELMPAQLHDLEMPRTRP